MQYIRQNCPSTYSVSRKTIVKSRRKMLHLPLHPISGGLCVDRDSEPVRNAWEDLFRDLDAGGAKKLRVGQTLYLEMIARGDRDECCRMLRPGLRHQRGDERIAGVRRPAGVQIWV